MKNRTKKGKIVVKKWGFRGLKGGNWEQKKCELAAKQKGKMVQNAGCVLKNGLKQMRAKL